MNRFFRWRAFTCFLLCALVVFSSVGTAGCSRAKSQSENAESAPCPVKVAEVKPGTITQKVTLAAKITPAMEVNVFPKISGKVASVPVEMGDRVKAGQLLVQLDTTDIALQVQQAEAALEVALAGQRSARAALENARANLARTEELFRQGVASQRDLDNARLAFDQASAGVADAQVKQAEAALASARQQLANSSITSPIAGWVSSRRIDPGEMASPTNPLLTIVDISSVFAECNVPESEVGRLKLGQKVPVKIPAVQAEPLEGELVNLAPAADQQSKAFAARIKLANPDGQIKPGMFAEVELSTLTRENVLVIPKEALVEKSGQLVVLVVKEGRAVETPVRTGISDGLQVEILEGLNAGDQVIVAGQNIVQNNARVEIVPSG